MFVSLPIGYTVIYQKKFHNCKLHLQSYKQNNKKRVLKFHRPTKKCTVLIGGQQGRCIEGLPLHADLQAILVNQKWRRVLEKKLGIEYKF